MNKIILMGRLARDPEVRYSSGAAPVAVANYTLAVNRRFKREGDPDTDFINCVAFGKVGEFAEKYLKKGLLISIVGRLQVRSWDDKDGKKRYATEVIVEEHYFAESKKENEDKQTTNAQGFSSTPNHGFYPIDESIEDEDLPF